MYFPKANEYTFKTLQNYVRLLYRFGEGLWSVMDILSKPICRYVRLVCCVVGLLWLVGGFCFWCAVYVFLIFPI